MRLLFVTQKVDKNDGPLGFVHGWIIALAQTFDQVTIICLQKGESSLPPSVRVLSLGKETHPSRLRYVALFWKHILAHRNEYDFVLVHMNQEYVLLGALIWKALGKKVALWYNHTMGGMLTKVAMALVDLVFHTSPYSFTAHTKRSRRMPAGIETEHLPFSGESHVPGSILYIGRLTPIKRPDVLIAATARLIKQGAEVTLDLYGAALQKDNAYYEEMVRRIESENLSKRIVFHGSIPNADVPVIYGSREVFVNLTPAGNYDKTVLEAMACGALPVVSSPAFNDIIPPEYRFKEGDSESLAETLSNVFSLPKEQKGEQRLRNREYVVTQHSMPVLMRAFKERFSSL